MDSLYTHLAKNPIVYVTRDIERAMGIAPRPGYFIITNKSPYALDISRKYPDNIWIIDYEERGSIEPFDTFEILQLPDVAKNISSRKIPILVFKNTPRIERLCKEKKWQLLNPSADLSEKVENKITQVEWLGYLSQHLPSAVVSKTKDIQWKDIPLIVQWAHSHTGEGTLFIGMNMQLQLIKGTFPEREARVTNFIKGPIYTVNVIVGNTGIVRGNISYQITGLAPFTNHHFSTIGNDWTFPKYSLDETAINEIDQIVGGIGKKLQTEGWKGLFGVDLIYDEDAKKIHLVEINARQPASSTYESQLQAIKGGATIFEGHLCALLGIEFDTPAMIDEGAQIVLRVSEKFTPESILHKADTLRQAGYSVIEYRNTKLNKDLLRIQSLTGIIEKHTILNTRGEIILQLLSNS